MVAFKPPLAAEHPERVRRRSNLGVCAKGVDRQGEHQLKGVDGVWHIHAAGGDGNSVV